MSFNKVTLLGHLGRDPELRYTPQGTAVCIFPLATNERRKDRDGNTQDVATWFRVFVWGRQAETASQYLSKGRPVYIEGRLRPEAWTDKDGHARYTLEVHTTEMQFVDAAKSSQAERHGEEPRSSERAPSDDDMPV